jgi:hypothetical protein
VGGTDYEEERRRREGEKKERRRREEREKKERRVRKEKLSYESWYSMIGNSTSD